MHDYLPPIIGGAMPKLAKFDAILIFWKIISIQ